MSEAARAPMIYGAISAAMADITAIGKGKYNQQQGFKFRGIDDVMNVLKPILTKHQIFTVPTVLEGDAQWRRAAVQPSQDRV